MSEVSFSSTSKGRRLLQHDSHFYYYSYSKKNRTYWTCIKKPSCKARLSLEDDVFYGQSGFHNHEPDVKKMERDQFVAKLKNEVLTNTTVPVPKLFKKCLSETAVDIETASAIPPLQQIKNVLYKVRSSTRPILPKTIEEISLSGEWMKTRDGVRDFLLVDKIIAPENRMMVFCSSDNLEKLCRSEQIFMDGTFKIVPKLFSQLYTIHGRYLGKTFPFAFCLLASKSKETYTSLFLTIRECAVNAGLVFQPKFVMIDFEKSCIAALEEVFPSIVVKGCFFHFSQCIWKQVQKLGLSTEYAENSTVRQFFRRAAALALVPPTMISDAFLFIEENQASTGKEDIFLSYMVETWLDEQDAKFPISLWNHFETDGPRTNNLVEAWHSSINNKATTRHLDLYKMIKFLQDEEGLNRATFYHLESGQEVPTQQRKKYRDLNNRINHLKEELIHNRICLEKYLDCVSYSIKFE